MKPLRSLRNLICLVPYALLCLAGLLCALTGLHWLENHCLNLLNQLDAERNRA